MSVAKIAPKQGPIVCRLALTAAQLEGFRHALAYTQVGHERELKDHAETVMRYTRTGHASLIEESRRLLLMAEKGLQLVKGSAEAVYGVKSLTKGGR